MQRLEHGACFDCARAKGFREITAQEPQNCASIIDQTSVSRGRVQPVEVDDGRVSGWLRIARISGIDIHVQYSWLFAPILISGLLRKG